MRIYEARKYYHRLFLCFNSQLSVVGSLYEKVEHNLSPMRCCVLCDVIDNEHTVLKAVRWSNMCLCVNKSFVPINSVFYKSPTPRSHHHSFPIQTIPAYLYVHLNANQTVIHMSSTSICVFVVDLVFNKFPLI